MSSSQSGLFWCATFVVLDAVQAVLFGSTLQRMDSFLIGFLVFGLASVGCLLAVLWTAPGQISTAFSDQRTLRDLNLSSAGGWLTYLGAIQLIEPAVAFTIFSGVIPLVLLAVAARADNAAPHTGRWERAGLALLTLGLLALAAFTIVGLSGFVRGGADIALGGIVLAALAGVFMAGMVLSSYRLSRNGVGPAAVFALRFPLYLVLAGAGFLAGLDHKGPVAPADLMVAVVLGLLVLAFPIYAVQKAVSLTSTSTLGAATALIPVVVFVLQIVEGRVAFAPATVVGLSIYSAGAIAAALGRAQGGRR